MNASKNVNTVICKILYLQGEEYKFLHVTVMKE